MLNTYVLQFLHVVVCQRRNVILHFQWRTEKKTENSTFKDICHTCIGVSFKHNVYFFLKSFKNWIFVWLSQSTSALQHWLHKCQYGILSVQCSPVQLRTVCPLTATCPPTSYILQWKYFGENIKQSIIQFWF